MIIDMKYLLTTNNLIHDMLYNVITLFFYPFIEEG